MAFADATCRGWEASSAPATGYTEGDVVRNDLRFGEIVVGDRYRLGLADGALIELDVVMRGGSASRFVVSWFNGFGDPQVLVSLDGQCELQAARQLEYDDRGQALYIVSLDDDLQPRGEPDWLNPPLEFMPRPPASPLKHRGDNAPLRVGMVDSGVNYRLPEINLRLARDVDGHLVGYDFWEMDDLPFDSHPVTTGFFVQRHGTRSASLLLREAPAVELVPYRYPRPDMSRMHALVQHAADHQVSIVGMPLGSNRAEDWGSFARAAQQHPEILFVASAGNNGRDIDVEPVFPASLNLDNLLVVSSADELVQPAEGVNWGRKSVDFLVPAEFRPALDFSARPVRVSGSSYAVSRVVALAARIKAAHRDWGAAQIIEELKRRYGANSPDVFDWVALGYIADPLAGAPIQKSVLDAVNPGLPTGPGYRLGLEVYRLDPRWTIAEIDEILETAYRILAQCGIVPAAVSAFDVEAPDYLRDLAVGSSRSLLEALEARRPTVLLARDTGLRDDFLGVAFGLGNSRYRPWLTNSVWLMRGVDDAGIALAHELFHVLANSGAHVNDQPNLMQAYTRPDSTALTAQQCRQAQLAGVANGLLQPRPE